MTAFHQCVDLTFYWAKYHRWSILNFAFHTNTTTTKKSECLKKNTSLTALKFCYWAAEHPVRKAGLYLEGLGFIENPLPSMLWSGISFFL